MSVSGLAIVAALVFGWGTLSARLERFDVTAPIIFVAAGLLLTHGPLTIVGIKPSHALIKQLTEFTLALVLFSDASRVGLHELRADASLYLRLLGVGLTGQAGLTLRLARLKLAVRRVLARDGVLELIGEENTHGNVDHAVEAQIAATAGRAAHDARSGSRPDSDRV